MAQKQLDTMIDLYSKRLEETTEALYSAFASYPLVDGIDGCTHCVFPEENARLHSKPLRDLQEDDLSKFAHKAMSTWGDEADFKHFLPRLMELMAEGSGWPISVDRLVRSKLVEADWQSWPGNERFAIGYYLQALWVCELLDGRYRLDVADFLAAVTRAGMRAWPYLELWSNVLRESVPAKRELADFINEVLEKTGTAWSTPGKKRIQTSGEAEIAEWILNPNMIDNLAEASAIPEVTDKANQALASLEWLYSIPADDIIIE